MFNFFKKPATVDVTPEDVKRRLAGGDKFTIVDVRTKEEFAGGHIPGARHIPLDELETRHGEIDQSGDVVLVCRSGKRSAKAFELLQGRGVENLKNMTGGMLGWSGPTTNSHI